MTRVAFPYPRNGAGWLGGVNYLRNLVVALGAAPGTGIEPVLLLPRGTTVASGFPDTERIESWGLRLHAWIAERGVWHRLEADPFLDALLRKNRIALLSHANMLGRRARTPVVGWIADFQHRHLPEFFSTRERAIRDEVFEKTCRLSARVIVSSEAARRDLTQFYPRWADKARVLRFVDCSSPASSAADRAEIESRYGFTGPYLLLPNQFWAHKNHRVVIDALGVLARTGRRPLVLATGHTQDYRRAGFFEGLMARRAELGLGDSFRVLGTVPYADLAGLMRHANAVVNPSLFEGWSTTVEEAKSLGKRVLLSAIPVHLEQAPARGTYFDPKDPESLSELLWTAWNDSGEHADARAAAEAAAQLPVRRESFARAYADIVREVVGG
jgi:glycosyltransferase involved in cell wall biosynthesis